jgi:hypothetical protein
MHRDKCGVQVERLEEWLCNTEVLVIVHPVVLLVLVAIEV